MHYVEAKARRDRWHAAAKITRLPFVTSHRLRQRSSNFECLCDLFETSAETRWRKEEAFFLGTKKKLGSLRHTEAVLSHDKQQQKTSTTTHLLLLDPDDRRDGLLSATLRPLYPGERNLL
jgi:hypothetical protein